MATMKTIRQVKTVFIIFIAFVCCWSSYIIVLLYDNSHSLPLPVHLYASMLAHLHASINFAIYGLMNRNLRSGFAAHLLACCSRLTHSKVATAVAAAAAYGSCKVQHSNVSEARCKREVGVSRSLIEYHKLQDVMDFDDTCRSNKYKRLTISY